MVPSEQKKLGGFPLGGLPLVVHQNPLGGFENYLAVDKLLRWLWVVQKHYFEYISGNKRM